MTLLKQQGTNRDYVIGKGILGPTHPCLEKIMIYVCKGSGPGEHQGMHMGVRGIANFQEQRRRTHKDKALSMR